MESSFYSLFFVVGWDNNDYFVVFIKKYNQFAFIFYIIVDIPTIGMLHGEEISLTLKARGFKGWVKRFLMKYGYRQANGFIASCHYIRDMAIEQGIDRSLIDVIPVCFNPRNLNQSKMKRKKGYLIISVGTIVERKGFHLLIDAVHMLKDELPEIKINIVGDGPFMPVIKDRIQKYKMEDLE